MLMRWMVERLGIVKNFILVTLALGCAVQAATAAEGADLAEQVRQMTGARTKIVWAHQVLGSDKHHGSAAPVFELMAFDTADGKIRQVLPGPASYGNPSITPDGLRIIYTDVPSLKMYVVDFDGRNKKFLAKGFALCTWIDPKSAVQWFYAARAEFNTPIHRYRIDNPKIKELVWDKVVSASNGFHISADGTRAGSEFPHPRAGVAVVADGTWDQYGSGCEGCLAPDNSYRFFHMGESVSHAGVMMYDAGGANKRAIWFENIPGVRDRNEAWNPRWSTDVRFMTLSSPNSGPRQNVYLGQFDQGFTKVTRWIQISTRPGQDLCSHAWIDPGLGGREGEVPFTVEIPAPETGGGPWEWDFGDGAKSQGRVGRHTYKKAGSYTAVARRGKTVVKGNVSVQPRKRPAVVVAELLDEKSLRIRFDEPVTLKDASVTLGSGTPVKSISLDKSGLKLLVRLGGKLGKTDTLRLKGIEDRAQVPNAAQPSVPVARPAWPVGRGELLLLWETQEKERYHLRADGRTFADTRLKPWKFARTDRYGAMELRGGLFIAVDAAAGVVPRCTKANEFTIQATISPDNLYQGDVTAPRRIISCQGGKPMSSVNFALAQEREELVFYISHRPGERTQLRRVVIGALTKQATNHVVVSYKSGRLVCTLNGKVVVNTDKVTGTLPWRRVSQGTGLSIGGPAGARFPWRGKVEGVALFARALTAAEAMADYAAYSRSLAKRKTIPRITMRAKLVAKSKTPSPASIAPYVDAMVINEYEVVKVLRGVYAGKKIRVAQWALREKKPTPLTRTQLGSVVELSVERFDAHPQLEAEITRSTLDEDFDMDRYADVTIRPTGKPRLVGIVLRPGELWAPLGMKVRFEAEKVDQYGSPIDVKLKWTAVGKGRIDVGTAYGAGRSFPEAHGFGKATVRDGVVVGQRVGTVTVTAEGIENPEVRCSVLVGMGPYPGVHACVGRPLTLGRGFRGDIDRMRLYRRVLKPDEVADHAAGKGLDKKDPDLVADWTFDRTEGGAYPNAAGKGLAARPMGKVEAGQDKGVRYVRVDGGSLQVASDPRLDIRRELTMEAWIRSRGGGGIFSRSQVWSWGFSLLLKDRRFILDGFRRSWSAMEAQADVSAKKWTHVVAVLGSGGLWRLYADGKLLREYKPRPQILFDSSPRNVPRGP